MPPETLEDGAFSSDVFDFLKLLHLHEVNYVIVGGEAVIFYGYPRLTGDVDFYYGLEKENAVRLFEALKDFWQGRVPEISGVADLLEPGMIIQFGRPPHRIDLLNQIDGMDFDAAWRGRRTVLLKGTPVHYIGLKDLLLNKRASGRHKDLDDLEHLE